MKYSRKVKVLIVDDSALFREFLAKGLSADAGIEVVATAKDPFDARDKIIEFEPDVMTLDVEMPKMNGIEFLKRLMPQYPIPVVVISSANDNVFDALDAGAVDFIAKPDPRSGRSMETTLNELKIKIKVASLANVSAWKSAGSNPAIAKSTHDSGIHVIAIGASTGGTEATYNLLKELPANMPGIVIVQHMPANFTRMYAERLNKSIRLEVKEAQHGDAVYPGRVLIAPGDYQMRVKKSGDKFVVDCLKGEKVSGHCPSVDVLFDSVAKEVGRNAMGIILTGMGQDGAAGLLAMRSKGARTLGQDEKSCVVYGMPKVAYNIGAVERQAPLEAIPSLICGILNQ
ncbi:MAG: chemotaxis response regulator protein-glutamate methylesterase [Pelosinus sp.]|nr:chemotaxis response regulator protein-glutamate methylesterase [Pelosinus sp.]